MKVATRRGVGDARARSKFVQDSLLCPRFFQESVHSCENVSNWTFRFGSKLKAPKHVLLGGEVVATMSYDNDLRTILEAL